MILPVKKCVQNERQLCTVVLRLTPIKPPPSTPCRFPPSSTAVCLQPSRFAFPPQDAGLSAPARAEPPAASPVSSPGPANQPRYPYALLLPRAAKLQLPSSPPPLEGTGCPGTSAPSPLPSPAPPGQFDRKAPAVMDLRRQRAVPCLCPCGAGAGHGGRMRKEKERRQAVCLSGAPGPGRVGAGVRASEGGREGKGRGGEGRKGKPVIDSCRELLSGHPSFPKFSFTRRELRRCHENRFYKAPSPFPLPLEQPNGKNTSGRGSARGGGPGASCRHPTRLSDTKGGTVLRRGTRLAPERSARQPPPVPTGQSGFPTQTPLQRRKF